MAKEIEVLLAPGLATEEGKRKANEALDRRNNADYRCYMKLREGIDNGFIFKDPTPDAPEEHNEWFDEVQEILRERVEANDDFAKAVAGR